MRKMETEHVIVFYGGTDGAEIDAGKLRLKDNDGSFRLTVTTTKEKTTREKAVGAALPAVRIAGRFALMAAKAALGMRGSSVTKNVAIKGMTGDWEEAKKAWQGGKVYETPVNVTFRPDEMKFDLENGVMTLRDGDVVVMPSCDGEEEKRILGQWKAFIEGEN